jgi:hypothetical protein
MDIIDSDMKQNGMEPKVSLIKTWGKGITHLIQFMGNSSQNKGELNPIGEINSLLKGSPLKILTLELSSNDGNIKKIVQWKKEL